MQSCTIGKMSAPIRRTLYSEAQQLGLEPRLNPLRQRGQQGNERQPGGQRDEDKGTSWSMMDKLLMKQRQMRWLD